MNLIISKSITIKFQRTYDANYEIEKLLTFKIHVIILTQWFKNDKLFYEVFFLFSTQCDIVT